MNPRRFAAAVLSTALLCCNLTYAFETDQYNLPDQPLADTGEEISEYIFANFQQAVAELNDQITKASACIETRTKGCDSAEKERKNLERLRSDDAPATALFKRIGDGNLFRTKFGGWLYSHQFRSKPASYKPPYNESVFLLNPVDYATLSPTYRLYGVEFGGDKLEHLLQQGYKYYTIYRDEIADGKTESAAQAKAIAWGKRTERTYFGLLSSGVFSNADLFANYVGMKFYLALTQDIADAPVSRAALQLSNGRWEFTRPVNARSFLKPFIADHLNEALNPSSFRLTLFPSVRRQVRKHACPKWRKAFPEMTRSSIDGRTVSLETWDGEDYGHTKRSRTLSIGEACFEDK